MPESAKQIRILLVDDHALFRESIARLLGREAGFDVVGDCGSIPDALTILRQRPVDLVLLDFDLGYQNGRDFMRLAKQDSVTAKVLIVTAGIQSNEAAELIRRGISGIFLKRDSAASLAQSIRDVMAGKVSFEQGVFQQAMTEVAPMNPAPGGERFTERERQVLSYVFEGLANKEIAGRIGVSESSIKAALQQLFAKTGVRTRSELVRIALERYKNDL
jgi:DNA-binding NarL/FixJ family response regulator